MSYPDLVRRLCKLYKREREITGIEYPRLEGYLADIIDPTTLPYLQGEYMINFKDDHVCHLLRVYYDGPTFEIEGTPGIENFMSSFVEN